MAQTWEYDGVDLTRYGYNIELHGAPLNTPGRRGENVIVPGKTGRLYVPKIIDQRVQTLRMWVINEPVDGGTGSEANMLANLDVLRELFTRDGQHTLRFTFGTDTRVATVEVMQAIDFVPLAFNQAYRFAVDFLMADPLWYGESSTAVGPFNIASNSQTGSFSNAGSVQNEQAVLTLRGPLQDPKLTIAGAWVQYTGAVDGAKTLVIDCGAFTAILDSVDVSGNISHGATRCWLPVPAGACTMTMESSVTGGTMKVEFTQAYI
jgi:hypothetical protein